MTRSRTERTNSEEVAENRAVSQAARSRRALLNWFRRRAKPLPWRGTRDPYAIWVSEVMLQQTQVATVIPYYLRFLRTFPSLERLARAPLERVLQMWSGLGYYRRARHLHRAAKIVQEEFNGRFPRNYDEARTLPGVGDYTARAVLSIAFNQPYAALDGNVARVIARVRGLRGHLSQLKFRRQVEHSLHALLSRRQPGNFNQALMELGQTICLPRAPRCPACPLRKSCLAFKLGKQESFPSPRPRRASETHFLAAAVIRRGDKVALVRGLDGGLLPDLWNFPAAFGRSRLKALLRLREKLESLDRTSTIEAKPLADLRHGITHRAIQVSVYPAEASGDNRALRWFRLSRLQRSAISQLTRKVTRQIL